MDVSCITAFLRSQIPDFQEDAIFAWAQAAPVPNASPESSGEPESLKPQPETAPAAPPRRRWKRYARQIGRPTLLTEEIANAMYEVILRSGISDSRAGRLSKVSPATVCRWKQEDPTFADFLEIARTRFRVTQLKKIRNTPVRNPRQDMRNAKWLLEYSNPERWGRNPRKLPNTAKSPRRSVPQSAKSAPVQQSKSTPNCSESHAASAAPNPELEARNFEHPTAFAPQPGTPNSEHQTAPVGSQPGIRNLEPENPSLLATRSALCAPVQQSKSMPNCSESPAASAAPNPELEARNFEHPTAFAPQPGTPSSEHQTAPVGSRLDTRDSEPENPSLLATRSALCAPVQQSKSMPNCSESRDVHHAPNPKPETAGTRRPSCLSAFNPQSSTSPHPPPPFPSENMPPPLFPPLPRAGISDLLP